MRRGGCGLVLGALLAGVALGSAALLAVPHGLGWREHVGFLTYGEADPVLGSLYILAWLQAWVVAPIAGLAAVLTLGWSGLAWLRGATPASG